ncbi:putative membrane protein [Prunus yedoensis var. nudiflora]|uniref:Putative membrane protein n=1 Tax=Prunus yedoensis var. nudiflora TaxID=2094558 RepID=A0A315APH7_PRUYE|nr:putative membrane protein [Prunus yedoensis var. nudiflora]
MSNNEEPVEETNGDSFHIVKLGLKDRSKKVAQTKEILSKQAVQTREILSEQAVKIAKQAEEHEMFINKKRNMCSNVLLV